jgi:hypothetical protein
MARTQPLPNTMTAAEKDAYRYGWRRARVARSLDDAERRYEDAPRSVFAAFHDGYEDRAVGREFGARPRGEAID